MPPLTDAPTGYDDTLMAQDQALQRRRLLLAEQARQAAQQAGVFAPYQPDNTEVGGFQLSTGQRIPGRIVSSPLGQIAQAAAPLVAQQRLQSDQAAQTRDEAAFNARARADAARRLQAMPTSTPAIAGHPEYTTGSGVAMTSGAPAQEPDLRTRLEWAAGLRDNPLTSSIGDSLTTDIITKEPERQEARAERRQTRADNINEARRKQADDLEFKRWQAEQNDQTKRDLAMLIHGGGSGGGSGGSGSSGSSAGINLTDDDGNPVQGWKRAGVKANEILKDVASDGSVTLTDKLTGQRLKVGGGGRTAASFDKDQQASRDAIERSTNAISEAPRAKVLLAQGSSSGIRADIRKAGSYIAPSIFGGKAQEADEALKPISDLYLKSVPRFEGPQSDKDTASYMAAAGQLSNTNLPPHVRSAALDEVVRLHQKAIDQQRARGGTPTNTTNTSTAPPTVMDAVKAAQRQHQGGWSVERAQ